jgi:PAS domain S-box-containing protein
MINKENTTLNGEIHQLPDQRTAEHRMINEVKRLKAAQELAHLGNWRLDFLTGKVIWSDEAVRIYGLDPDEIEHTVEGWLSFVHPDDRNEVIKKIDESNALMKGASFIHRIIRRDGVIRHIHSQSEFEFDEKGKSIGLLGIAHDITEITLAERKLKTQYEILMEISYMQSHMVRGPVATLLGLVNLFNSDDIEDPINAEIIAKIKITAHGFDDVIRKIIRKTNAIEMINANGE